MLFQRDNPQTGEGWGGGFLDPHPNSKIALSQAKQINILPSNMTFRTDKDLE